MSERIVVTVAWSLAACVVTGGVLELAAFALARRFGLSPANRCRLLLCALCTIPAIGLVTLFRLLHGDEVSAVSAARSIDLGADVLPFVQGAARHGLGLSALLTLGWGIGAAFFAIRLARRWLTAGSLRRAGCAPAGAALHHLASHVARRIGVRPPTVLISSVVAVPTVVGVRRPVVLLPVAVDQFMTRAQLQYVLGHELAHIRRRDPAVNMFQAAVEAALFFCPSVHRLSGEIRADREFACDEIAARTFGQPLILARALERLETLRARRAHALALAADDPPLLRRIVLLAAPTAATAHGGPHHALATMAGITALGILCATAVPASLTDDAIRLRAPAATIRQEIQATDDAGAFTLSVVGYRAVAATFEGRPFPAAQIRQRGSDVRFTTTDGSTLFAVRLRPAGGMTWQSR